MGLFKKKSVPAELPSLAVDDVRSAVSSVPLIPAQSVSAPTLPEAIVAPTSYKPLPVASPTQTVQQTTASVKAQVQATDESGYFKNLVKSITEETEDLDKLSSWYKNKFLPGDMVFQMREYWQKQQPELLLKNISGELKTKLMEKTDKLHALEKEWQDVYFTLLSKEEEIRKEEKDLKDSLAEFINLIKRPNEKE